jgi:hypothetical protein
MNPIHIGQYPATGTGDLPNESNASIQCSRIDTMETLKALFNVQAFSYFYRSKQSTLAESVTLRSSGLSEGTVGKSLPLDRDHCLELWNRIKLEKERRGTELKKGWQIKSGIELFPILACEIDQFMHFNTGFRYFAVDHETREIRWKTPEEWSLINGSSTSGDHRSVCVKLALERVPNWAGVFAEFSNKLEQEYKEKYRENEYESEEETYDRKIKDTQKNKKSKK